MSTELLTNAEVRTALRGSIRKWEEVATGFSEELGAHNCPLCHIFSTAETAAENSDCNGCPVKEYSGQINCFGTPYRDWVTKRSKWSISSLLAITDNDKLLAMAEVDFLKMLDKHYFTEAGVA